MGVETASFVSDLVSTNPPSTDLVAQGDDHLRLLKAVLQATFPIATKPFYFPGIKTKSADYTILEADENLNIVVDATAANRTMTLPTLDTDNLGWRVKVTKSDSSSHTVTVAGTINGDGDGMKLTVQYEVAEFEWTGTAWLGHQRIRMDDSGVALIAALTIAGILTLSSTSHFLAPGGTTAQRPGSPAAKMVRFNTDTALLEFYDGANWVNPGSLPRGHIDGLTLANGNGSGGGDTTNDITVQPGKCRDSTDTVDIVIATAISKQIDANWTAGGTTGSPVGGRNSGAGLANDTTYHAYAARTATSTAGDLYFHTSRAIATVLTALQAETGGASYAYLRYLGSVRRATATNRKFKQDGDYFEWIDVSATDASSSGVTTTGDTSLDIASGLPGGQPVVARVAIRVSHASTSAQVFIHNADNAEVTPSGAAQNVTVQARSSGAEEFDERHFRMPAGSTTLSAKSTASSTSVSVVVKAYWNPRGSDA